MPDLGLGAPPEVWGRESAQFRRGRLAEPGTEPVRQGRLQVADDGVCKTGRALIFSSI
ncbi:hypothetical protein D3C77_283960 [compost metagenome]